MNHDIVLGAVFTVIAIAALWIVWNEVRKAFNAFDEMIPRLMDCAALGGRILERLEAVSDEKLGPGISGRSIAHKKGTRRYSISIQWACCASDAQKTRLSRMTS